MDICDFGNSYLFWTGKFNPNDDRKPGHMPWNNTIRIQMDSRCQLVNEKTGESEWYYLITPCRTEWMYRSDVLWQLPNYEFCGIWSSTEYLAGHVKTGDVSSYGGDMRVAHPIEGRYLEYEMKIRHFQEVQQLENDEQVVKATREFRPIIARTEIRDDKNGMRAVIEYPVKTMNVQLEHKRMQVDTGPLIFPDLSAPVEREIEKLSMAYVCYNTDDVAEFILRKPMSITKDGDQVGTIIDYSEVRRVPVKTTLYSAGPL